MLVHQDEFEWARQTFGQCQLGDKRRVERLIRTAALQARAPGRSTYAVAQGFADVLGTHRLLYNKHFTAQDIALGLFRATAAHISEHDELLAIEDTTTVGFTHKVAKGLGDMGGKLKTKRRGLHVHSVLLFDQKQGLNLGLIEQHRWKRSTKTRGKRHERKKRPYKVKESFKWQRASEHLRQRLDRLSLQRLISVCDREADVFEYLQDKLQHAERFIVRASWNRKVLREQKLLFDLMIQAPVIAHHFVDVAQRSGRRARKAKLALRAGRVRLKPPRRPKGSEPVLEALEVNVVVAQEVAFEAGSKPIRWVLVTSEPISTAQAVWDVVEKYRHRWPVVEKWHKSWKSDGCNVEGRRVQNADGLEKLAVILGAIAVRVEQLKQRVDSDPKGAEEQSCEVEFEEDEWQCLFRLKEKSAPPDQAPSLRWAYHTLGWLGGWKDTKRTGRVGVKALQYGYQRLQDVVAGLRISRQLSSSS